MATTLATKKVVPQENCPRKFCGKVYSKMSSKNVAWQRTVPWKPIHFFEIIAAV